jgi:hypothetical protein
MPWLLGAAAGYRSLVAAVCIQVVTAKLPAVPVANCAWSRAPLSSHTGAVCDHDCNAIATSVTCLTVASHNTCDVMTSQTGVTSYRHTKNILSARLLQ